MSKKAEITDWTPKNIRATLINRGKNPQVLAIMAIIDGCIEKVREASEIKGLGTIERSECCGAAAYMRALKVEIGVWLAPNPVEPEK